VTKHSHYFVWKDTSERVVRRCDNTVDKKRVNSCVLKYLFLEGVDQPKISPKPPGNAFSDALLMPRFQNFAVAAKRKNALRAHLINEWFWINSGPKILRSCLLHCQRMTVLRSKEPVVQLQMPWRILYNWSYNPQRVPFTTLVYEGVYNRPEPFFM